MDDYTVTDWHIEEDADGNSVLTANFIPWRTGNIQLPAIAGELLSPMVVVPMSPSVGDNVTVRVVYRPSDDGGVVPPPVTVVSVLKQGAAGEELRPPQGPLFSPITVHMLYGWAAAAIGVLMALCVTLAKWRRIHSWLLLRAMQAAERRNARTLKKRLDELLKGGTDDAAFCAELQQAIRSYLGTRFDDDLGALTTGEVAVRVAAKTAVAAAETEEAYNDTIDVLRRADYVRFALVPLEPHEREGLAARVLDAARVLGGVANA